MQTSIQNAEVVTDQEKMRIATDVKFFNPWMKIKNKLALYTGLSILEKNELEIFALMLRYAQQNKITLPVELIQKYVLTKTHGRTAEDKRKTLFEKTVSTLKKIASVNFSLLFDQDDKTERFVYIPSMFNIVNVYKDKDTGGLVKIEFDFNSNFWSLIDPNFINNNSNYMHVNIEHLSMLSSKYAQRLYLLLSTYRYSEFKGLSGQEEGTGQVVVRMSLENSSPKMPCLRDFLCIPPIYKPSSFRNQIIEPAIKQIKKLNDIHDIIEYRNELEKKGYSKENIESNIEKEKTKGSFGMFLELNAKFLAKPHSKSYGGVEFSFVYKDPQLSAMEQIRLWNERNGSKAQTGLLVDQQNNPRAETQLEASLKKSNTKKDAEIARLKKLLKEQQQMIDNYREYTMPDGLKQLEKENVPDNYVPPRAENHRDW